MVILLAGAVSFKKSIQTLVHLPHRKSISAILKHSSPSVRKKNWLKGEGKKQGGLDFKDKVAGNR